MGALSEQRRATIYDVAKAAGVSPSTVSRAFSRPGRVSDHTSERIHAVAVALGYRSDRVPRLPQATQTKLLGLMSADITNPFVFSIIRGAEHAAAAVGYSVVLLDGQESEVVENETLERVTPALAGLIVASSRQSDAALLAVAKRLPTVVMNRVMAGLSCVIPDNAGGTRQALSHLAELGHCRVLYVAGPAAAWADGARWQAVRDGCREFGLTESRIGPAAPTVRGGQSMVRPIQQSQATAVLCYNDMLAIGVLRGLQAAGARVPEDISVVGYDNIFASDLVTPGLTTVVSPLGALGEKATETLIGLFNHSRAPHSDNRAYERVLTLPMKLVVRQSTARAQSR